MALAQAATALPGDGRKVAAGDRPAPDHTRAGDDAGGVIAGEEELLAGYRNARTLDDRKAIVAKLGEAGSVKGLSEVLANDPSEALRLLAVGELLKRDTEPAAQALESAIGKWDPWVSRAVVDGLIQHQPKHAVDRLAASGLTSTRPQLLAAAIEVVAATRGASTFSAKQVDKLVAATSWRVRAATARALPRISAPKEARAHLLKLCGDASPRVRIAALSTLRPGPGKTTRSLLRAARTDKIWQVRLAAVESLARDGERVAKHRRAMTQLAKQKKHDWRLRAACVAALGTVRALEAVDDLIALLPKTDGRLQAEVHRALTALTQQPLRQTQDWKLWWSKAREGYVFPQPKPKAPELPTNRLKTRARFYGHTITSLRPCFVIDCSGSMSEPAKPPRRWTQSRKQRTPRTWTKFQVATWELAQALRELPKAARFGVLLFRDRVIPIQQSPARAKKSVIERVLRLVRANAPSGATDVHAALADVLHGSGPRDPLASGRVAFDAIYLLSDGLPTAGDVIEPTSIRTRVKAYNAFARATIHTVGIGQQNKAFLSALAQEHRGRYQQR